VTDGTCVTTRDGAANTRAHEVISAEPPHPASCRELTEPLARREHTPLTGPQEPGCKTRPLVAPGNCARAGTDARSDRPRADAAESAPSTDLGTEATARNTCAHTCP